MVYNAQNYSTSGLYPLSRILHAKNTMLWKLDVFPSSCGGGGDTYSVGSLRKS
jgi:hypothetical protein